MITWAAISGATASMHDYKGLVACRFMLGFVEAVGSAFEAFDVKT